MPTSDRVDSLATTDWLADHLDDPAVRILDVRGFVHHRDQPDGTMVVTYEAAAADYAAGHVPGAHFVDWTTDVVDMDDRVPVQVASAAQLGALFGRLGLTPTTHVVVYDQAGSTLSTRLWWVFRYAGHDRVSILDGGYARWQKEGRPTTTAVPTVAATTYAVQVRSTLRATIEATHAASQAGGTLLIDARPAEQFRGDVIRSGRAGHIPRAVSLPVATLFRPEGGLRPVEELRSVLQAAGVSPDRPVLAYCGGGVAATGVLFALDRIGHANWSNFDGSWNEWGPRTDLPATIEPGAGGAR